MLVVGDPLVSNPPIAPPVPIQVRNVAEPSGPETASRYLSQQWLRIGIECHQEGKLDRAEQMYREALWADPTHIHAVNGIGVVFMQRQKYLEAIQWLERACELAPEQAPIWSNLAVAYSSAFRYAEAAAAAAKAVELDVKNPEAALNYAAALAACGRKDDAVSYYAKAIELNPELAAAQSNRIFCRDLMSTTTPADALAERRVWYNAFGKRHTVKQKPHTNARTTDRPIRVGYMTADCRLHSAVFCWGPVVSQHDRNAVIPVMYNNMGLDKADDVTNYLRKAVPDWRDVSAWSDDQLADQIRADQIDVLVDLAGHSNGNRLAVFCMKPAPIAVTAWGYATGTGVPEVDYFIADRVALPPEARAGYSESVVYLPSIVPYGPPAQSPPISPLPAWENRHITFGSFNRIEKCVPGTFDLWSRVLHAIPDSRFVLKSAEYDRAPVIRRAYDEFARCGIPRERVTIAGESAHVAHLHAFRMIDISLDPFPHTGGVTSLESLWMGVPVITLVGPRTVERLTASFLTTLGLTDWIAQTPDDYVDIAARFAKDRPFLSDLRMGLRKQMQDSILRSPQYVRCVEAAYKWMWRRYLGLEVMPPSEPVTVPVDLAVPVGPPETGAAA